MNPLKLLMLMLFAWYFSISRGDGQNIIASAGSQAVKDNTYFCWTIGEGIVETFINTECMLTQGFHQPFLDVTSVEEVKGLDLTITAFPNPASDFLILRLQGKESTNLKEFTVVFLDGNGKVLFLKKIQEPETVIPVNDLIPETYFLKVLQGAKVVKVFKIIKT
jgi:hypothetical protein